MSEAQTEKRGPGGRPTLYRKEYCEQAVDFCRSGYSLTGFAGHIGVDRDTISEWGKVHPEFSVAIKRAKAAAALSYEEDAITIRKRGGGPGRATIVIFGLKNMAPDDYKDKQELEHLGPGGGPLQFQRIERVVVDPQNTDS